MLKTFIRPAGIIAGALGLASISFSVQALTLQFSPQSQSVYLGNQASMDAYLNFDGDLSAPFVKSFSVSVSFNPALLSLPTSSAVTFDYYLNGGVAGDSTQSVSIGSGTATITESSSLDSFDLCIGSNAGGQCFTSTGFRLFTMDFNAISLGESALVFNSITATDDYGNSIAIAKGPNGSIGVQAAPIPASEPSILSLLGWGVLALATSLRRDRRAV